MDDLRTEVDLVASWAALIGETNSDSAKRAAAEAAVKTFQEWSVGCDYREDVYKVIKAFADTQPSLSWEDKKLLNETLRDYRRAGMELSTSTRKEVEQWRRDVAKLAADFEANIAAAKAPVVFTRAELDGLPDDFFSSPGIKINNDSSQVLANVMWQYNTCRGKLPKRSNTKKALRRPRLPCQTRERPAGERNSH